MDVSVDSSTPDRLNTVTTSCNISSPMLSPSSDKRYWSSLHNRIDTLLENRKAFDPLLPTQPNSRENDRAKLMKEDSLLLLRGFDSVAHSLSQLSKNLDDALQGARELVRPPTLTDIYHSAMENAMKNAKSKETELVEEKVEGEEGNIDEGNRGVKRKIEEQRDHTKKENEKIPKEEGKLKRAKNLAISMATKAASLAQELKSIKSGLCFMQERCAVLEEENRRLRDGFSEGIRPEEDDLVRLQLEALLAEKSRLANDNANLTRENQCLHQLVEYHQLTSHDLSASYENVIRGLCLDFSEEDRDDEESNVQVLQTPRREIFGFRTSLDECYDDDDEEEEERKVQDC